MRLALKSVLEASVGDFSPNWSMSWSQDGCAASLRSGSSKRTRNIPQICSVVAGLRRDSCNLPPSAATFLPAPCAPTPGQILRRDRLVVAVLLPAPRAKSAGSSPPPGSNGPDEVPQTRLQEAAKPPPGLICPSQPSLGEQFVLGKVLKQHVSLIRQTGKGCHQKDLQGLPIQAYEPIQAHVIRLRRLAQFGPVGSGKIELASGSGAMPFGVCIEHSSFDCRKPEQLNPASIWSQLRRFPEAHHPAFARKLRAQPDYRGMLISCAFHPACSPCENKLYTSHLRPESRGSRPFPSRPSARFRPGALHQLEEAPLVSNDEQSRQGQQCSGMSQRGYGERAFTTMCGRASNFELGCGKNAPLHI